MSLTEYFTEAEDLIAAETGGVDNVLLNGATYTGVWGVPVVQEIMLPTGGYRKRTVIPVTITRDQFTAAPVSKHRVSNPKLSPSEEYTVDTVGTSDPFHYVLTAIKSG